MSSGPGGFEEAPDLAQEGATGSPLGSAFAILFIGIGAASLSIPRPTPVEPPDFHLTGLVADGSTLARLQQRDAALVRRYPLDALAKEVVDHVVAFGLAEARTGDGREPERSRAEERLKEAMNRYWFGRGEEAYQALVARLADRAARAFESVLSRARDANADPRTWVAQHPKAPETRELHAMSGTFLDSAVSWRLVTRDGKLAGDSTALIRIHAKLRLYLPVMKIKDYTFLMHIDELRALWKWRIEGDPTLPMKQRLKVIGWLRDIEPDYPIYRVLGAIYAQQGRYEQAIAFYREALIEEPFDPLLRRNLAFLLKAVGPREPTSGTSSRGP